MQVRRVLAANLSTFLSIYNQGIEERLSTLETKPKDEAYFRAMRLPCGATYHLVFRRILFCCVVL